MKYKLKKFVAYFSKHYHHVAMILVYISYILYINFSSPFFWDEAWSYMRTLDWMIHNKISINPASIDPEISRAHPLGFYFLICSFSRIFGVSKEFFHIFMSVVNCLLIFLLVHEIINIRGKILGVLILVLVSIQEVIIVQLPFVLPEITIASLSILSIIYYSQKRYLASMIACIVVIYIKESSIALLCALWVYQILEYLIGNKNLKSFILLLPTALLIVHFMILKYSFGWFVYPVHAGFIQHPSLSIIANNLYIIYHFVFIEQGRILFTYLLLLLIIGKTVQIIGQRGSISSWASCLSQKKLYLSLLIFFVSYLGFSATNFLMTRYLIPLVLLLMLLSVFLIDDLIKNLNFKLSIIAFLILVTAWKNFTIVDEWIDDSKFNSRAMINVHLETVKFMEKSVSRESIINTHFLMQTCLTKKYAGYLEGDTFKNVHIFDNSFPANFIILSSMEYNDSIMDQLKSNQQGNYFLLKRFSSPPAWCEIFKKK